MKQISFLSGLLFFISNTVIAQLKISEGANYSQPLQVDSSSNYVFGSLIDKTSRAKYNFGANDIYATATGINNWTNIFVYNSDTKQSKKLFTANLVSIYPVTQVYMNSTYYYGSYKGNMNSAILKNNILIAAKMDEYNKDGVIDEDDPTYLFMSSKDGNRMVQISPKETNVTTWQLSKDCKTILLICQKDANSDKKFSNEDEILFQIDLDEDLAKIKISQIKL